MSCRAKVIKIRQLPTGVPKINEDFVIQEIQLPVLKDKEILIEAEWISVDPYLRGKIVFWGVGEAMQSYQIAKILKSNDPNYKVGDYIYGHLKWQTKQIITSQQVSSTILAKDRDNRLSLSHYVGAYGMPGATAWYGMISVGKLKHGENVLISGAAGAVGSYAGQIAKLYDCYVVGIAGSDDKIKFITNELGFDYGINYKLYNNDANKLQETLKRLFPDGIDVYFDNTGGFITESVWEILADRARVLICGQIAVYNKGGNLARLEEKGQFQQLKCFLVNNFKERDEFHRTMKKWIIENKIKARETIVDGFTNIPKAFVGLFSGSNTGKMVVRSKL